MRPFLPVFSFIIAIFCAGSALAVTGWDDAFCHVAELITGRIGSGMASIGILTVAIGAVMGRVSWGLALTVAIGISALFTAPFIAERLTGVDINGINGEDDCLVTTDGVEGGGRSDGTGDGEGGGDGEECPEGERCETGDIGFIPTPEPNPIPQPQPNPQQPQTPIPSEEPPLQSAPPIPIKTQPQL